MHYSILSIAKKAESVQSICLRCVVEAWVSSCLSTLFLHEFVEKAVEVFIHVLK